MTDDHDDDMTARHDRPLGASIRSLYVHIPFCERKCEYCDFASVAGMRGHAEYVAALRAELRGLAAAMPGVELDTVFVGGGTPGLLPPAELSAVAAEMRSCFALRPGAELTLEANPSSTTQARAEAWLEAGFNRVSIGVQSLEPDVLRFLGRIHGPGRALEALAAVRRAGFERINADLIYAVPGLDDARWQATLERILELDPGHLSCYELTVEEGTPLHAAVAAGEVVEADPEAALRQHWLAVDAAAAADYRQYEVSNLARPGQECRHNLAYWRNHHYLAAGAGAHGHLPAAAAVAAGILPAAPTAASTSVRYWHPRDPAAYVAAVAAGTAAEGAEVVTADDAEAERIMVGLRLADGLELNGPRAAAAADLAGAGLLRWNGARAILTRRGQEVLNQVALRLVAAA